MYWLSKHPKWGKARTVEVSTRSFGLSSPVVTVEDDEASDANRRLAYLPSFSETYSLWHQRRYMSITRTKVQESYYRTSETLQIKYVLLLPIRHPARVLIVSPIQNSGS